ncbi:DUF3501 family protein [Sulfobacillus harzensis]|uniref:DUF3501 family protein n=1 Tax=Sulfobacillus harzensis TaxID=2729629 RepID=A0A7Y0Q4M9_9FIRM|nr:DUF3501 family protein [Sulfobacillus harzensis]NMP24196.1 DUF3501 family protein [Sulfobacillus harzensis]
MKPMVLADIKPIPQYQAERDAFRRRIIALKKVRRTTLGPRVSVVFENRDTMLFQVQEMCRIEHIEDPALVQQEIDVYNDLLPEGLAIGATLLIELVQTDDMPVVLRELSGLEETIWLKFGPHAIHAEAEPGRSTEEKTSSVHYLTFRFSPDQRQALLDADSVRITSELPNYRYGTVLPRETVASLAADLLNG